MGSSVRTPAASHASSISRGAGEGGIGRGGSGGKWGDAFCSGRGMEVEDAEEGGWTGLDVVAEGQQGGLGRAEAGWRGDDV